MYLMSIFASQHSSSCLIEILLYLNKTYLCVVILSPVRSNIHTHMLRWRLAPSKAVWACAWLGPKEGSPTQLTGVIGLCYLLAAAATFLQQWSFARHFTFISLFNPDTIINPILQVRNLRHGKFKLSAGPKLKTQSQPTSEDLRGDFEHASR